MSASRDLLLEVINDSVDQLDELPADVRASLESQLLDRMANGTLPSGDLRAIASEFADSIDATVRQREDQDEA